ncbi:MAG TPA: hypothetical protein VKP30_26985, partial [Polyangiaceae bacterium]|nr:hypothetical protein [Polyangiaceae bacterium]
MRLRPRPHLFTSTLLSLLALGTIAQAAPTSVPSAVANPIVRAPATGGQSELAVGFDAQGKLRAAVCPSAGCDIGAGIELAVPPALVSKRSQVRIQIVPIGEHRHAVYISVPGEQPGQHWQAVLVSKPGKPNPEIIFQGMTGYVEGEEGLRRGPSVEISEPIEETGVRRVLVGEQREELTLCGRPAVLSPKMLAAKELALKPAKVQRLSGEEREKAPKLIAEPIAKAPVAAPDQPNPNGSIANQPAKAQALGGNASLLRPIGATSAVGWPASLTDGNLETTWAENRGGAGRGEFVSFHAPSDVPLQSFEFAIRPEKREIKHGVGPEKLWLVTDKLVYLVTFPTDPWRAPGVFWKVTLPTPVQTACVAIVSESAFGEKPDAEVTLAEVNARSEFTTASIDNLVGALAGGGPRADAAGT